MDKAVLNAFIAEHVYGEPEPTDPVPDGVMAGVNEIKVGSWIATTSGYADGDKPIWMPANFCEDAELAGNAASKACMENGWACIANMRSTGVIHVTIVDVTSEMVASAIGIRLSYVLCEVLYKMYSQLGDEDVEQVEKEYDFADAKKNPYIERPPASNVVIDIALLLTGAVIFWFLLAAIART